MVILNSFSELVELPLYQQVFVFTGSTYKMYRKAGYRSALKNNVILSSDNDFKVAIGVTEFEFNARNKSYVVGEFDPVFIGKLMIDKLKEEIKSVEETYLTLH